MNPRGWILELRQAQNFDCFDLMLQSTSIWQIILSLYIKMWKWNCHIESACHAEAAPILLYYCHFNVVIPRQETVTELTSSTNTTPFILLQASCEFPHSLNSKVLLQSATRFIHRPTFTRTRTFKLQPLRFQPSPLPYATATKMETNNKDLELSNLFDVKGKVALITGGGQSIYRCEG